jgi:hypothetical protein
VSRLFTVYVIGVAGALILLWVGLAHDQSAITTGAVMVALFVGLLTLLSQILSANGLRYAEHKDYFADTLLSQAGGMRLVAGDGVILLPKKRLAWKLKDDSVPSDPGIGETPLFDGMLRPHLRTGGAGSGWSDFADAFFKAEGKVKDYTQARHSYDEQFEGKLTNKIRERVGEGFRPAWCNERARDHPVTESKYADPTYNARSFMNACQLSYSGDLERVPGNQWSNHRPVSSPEDRSRGIPWRIKVGDGDSRDYLWGGPVPMDLEGTAQALGGILESLRNDVQLKQLYLDAQNAEQAAKESLGFLPVLAADAAHLLRHGPDIPGTCRYCSRWSPRL